MAARKSAAVVNTVSLEYLYDKAPFATFNFKYRSIGMSLSSKHEQFDADLAASDALKSLLIIPQSPSLITFEEIDVDNLTPAEMRTRLIQLERVSLMQDITVTY